MSEVTAAVSIEECRQMVAAAKVIGAAGAAKPVSPVRMRRRQGEGDCD